MHPVDIDTYDEIRHARACPGHPRLNGIAAGKTWMAGTSPAMTRRDSRSVIARSEAIQNLSFRDGPKDQTSGNLVIPGSRQYAPK
jgi:hypothetical protein